MINKPVFLTGATGFVGQVLHSALIAQGFVVRAAVRESSRGQFAEEVIIDDKSLQGNYEALMQDCGSVIHLAARAHVLNEQANDPAAAFMQANKELTLDLANSAVKAGISRFIFVSSIGVNGNQTFEKPFSETDTPQPHDLYAQAKWQAEQGLWEIAKASGLEVVVVRPTLVYGAGAKGNFQRLLKLVQSGLPLPLAAVNNQRSLIGVENLCDLLICCLQHQNAAGETFLAADGEDISTPDLLRVLAAGLNRTDRLWYFPIPLLRIFACLAGKQTEFDRLCRSLRVDTTKIRQYLEWKPVTSQKDGLLKMTRMYRVLESLS